MCVPGVDDDDDVHRGCRLVDRASSLSQRPSAPPLDVSFRRHARAVVQRRVGRRRRRGGLRSDRRRPRRRARRPTDTCPRRPSGRIRRRRCVRVRSERPGRCAQQQRVHVSVVQHVAGSVFDVQHRTAQYRSTSTAKPQSLYGY